MPILECDNLTKRFGSVEALTDVSFSVEPGRIVGLLGPNGSGKTTMIKLINGLLTPTSGQVLIDGEAFNSCIYLAVWADGKHIRTLESLMGPDGELSDIQQAFIEETAVQCGFCTPGFIMTAVEILETNRLYTDDELRKLLSGHLCRCTGYENILRAVKKTMYRRLGLPLPE